MKIIKPIVRAISIMIGSLWVLLTLLVHWERSNELFKRSYFLPDQGGGSRA